ncbi:MAG: hypothetical protein K6F30_09000 [Lachnospiraceae bacterium]|nr:hypothetical protein [Lachnospiraceae bacterium]
MDYSRNLTNKEMIEDLKLQLQKVQMEKKKLEEEINRLQGEEKRILGEISKLSDTKYEADMLQLVYEQRKKTK